MKSIWESLKALGRRMQWWWQGSTTVHSPESFAALERNLRAEGYLLTLCECGRCGHLQRNAVHPEKVNGQFECGHCHHLRSEVVEIEVVDETPWRTGGGTLG